MLALAQHALLVLSAGLLALTGWRIADRAAPSGLARAVAAAVLAVALAVLEALVLGLFGLAGEPLVLAAAAAATFAAAHRLLPRPQLGAREELAAWWAARPPRERAGIGGLLGVLLGWTAWQLQHPYVGDDGFTYHLPLAAGYVQTGTAGAIIDFIEGVPVANYPVTNEVALGWALALSDSWVVASVWNPLLVAVLVAAGWLGLRGLRVPAAVRVAALAAYLSLPLLLTQVGGPLTDLPCAAWLVAAGALAVASRTHPALLAIALVAAGLSFGTKTTGSVLLAAALLTAAWQGRDALRRLHPAWAALVPVAVGVGGVWVLRNLIDHGSPLWPLVAMPWGTDVPPAFAAVDDSFLSHPGAMLDDGRASDYTNILSGGTFLLVGGLLAFSLARTRATIAASAAVAVASFAWMAAPYTGIDQPALAVGALRYLLPALAAATLALSLAARDAGRTGRIAVLVLLWVATVSSIGRTWEFGFPFVPSLGTVIVLALLGAGAALLVAPRVPAVAWRAAPAAAAVAVVVALTVGADGYLGRHAESGRVNGGLVRAALATPGFDQNGLEISMGPASMAFLRGEELQHELRFLDSPHAVRGGPPPAGARLGRPAALARDARLPPPALLPGRGAALVGRDVRAPCRRLSPRRARGARRRCPPTGPPSTTSSAAPAAASASPGRGRAPRSSTPPTAPPTGRRTGASAAPATRSCAAPARRSPAASTRWRRPARCSTSAPATGRSSPPCATAGARRSASSATATPAPGVRDAHITDVDGPFAAIVLWHSLEHLPRRGRGAPGGGAAPRARGRPDRRRPGPVEPPGARVRRPLAGARPPAPPRAPARRRARRPPARARARGRAAQRLARRPGRVRVAPRPRRELPRAARPLRCPAASGRPDAAPAGAAAGGGRAAGDPLRTGGRALRGGRDRARTRWEHRG